MEKIKNINERFDISNKDIISSLNSVEKDIFIFGGGIIEENNAQLLVVGNTTYIPQNDFPDGQVSIFSNDSYYLIDYKFNTNFMNFMSTYLPNYHFSKYGKKYIFGLSYAFFDYLNGLYKILDITGNSLSTIEAHSIVFRKNIAYACNYFGNPLLSKEYDNAKLIENHIDKSISLKGDRGVEELTNVPHYYQSFGYAPPMVYDWFHIQYAIAYNDTQSLYLQMMSSIAGVGYNSKFVGAPLSNKEIDKISSKDYFVPFILITPLYNRELIVTTNYVLPTFVYFAQPTLVNLLMAMIALEADAEAMSNAYLITNTDYNSKITGHFNLYSSASSRNTEIVVADVVSNIAYCCPSTRLLMLHYEDLIGWFNVYYINDSDSQDYEGGNTTYKPISRLQQAFPEEYLFVDLPIYTKIKVNWYDGNYDEDDPSFEGIFGIFDLKLNSDYSYNTGTTSLNKIYFDVSNVTNVNTEYPAYLNNVCGNYDITNITYESIGNNVLPLCLSINTDFFTTIYRKICENIRNKNNDNNISVSFLCLLIYSKISNYLYRYWICRKYQGYDGVDNTIGILLNSQEDNNYSRTKLFPKFFVNEHDYTIKVYKINFDVSYDYELPNQSNNNGNNQNNESDELIVKLGTSAIPFYFIDSNKNIILPNNMNLTITYNDKEEIYSKNVNGYLSYSKIGGNEDLFYFYFDKYLYIVSKEEETKYKLNYTELGLNEEENSNIYIKLIDNLDIVVNNEKFFKKYFKIV